MKGQKKFHLEVSTSSSGKTKTHKFSDVALQYLAEELNNHKGDPNWIADIKEQYRQRNTKQEGINNG